MKERERTVPFRQGEGNGSSSAASLATQGLSDVRRQVPSVEELVEEGQSIEAALISGVKTPRRRRGEVHTKQVPEDDIPPEYLETDETR
jgi:hypothetical protein